MSKATTIITIAITKTEVYKSGSTSVVTVADTEIADWPRAYAKAAELLRRIEGK